MSIIILTCGSYAELNPVRAGMVKAPKDYPWSSYGVNAYGKKDNLIDKHIIFNKLSTDESVRKEYRSFVQQMQRQHESMRGDEKVWKGEIKRILQNDLSRHRHSIAPFFIGSSSSWPGTAGKDTDRLQCRLWRLLYPYR